MRTHHVDRNCTETAHRIHNVYSTGVMHQMADFFHLIQHTAGRLAVHYRDVRNPHSWRQRIGDQCWSKFLVLRNLKNVQCDAVNTRCLSNAPPVSAVDQHQQFAVTRNCGRDDRFDHERAAALHENAFVLLSRIRTKIKQTHTDFVNRS